MRLTDEFIEQVRQNTDIVELIGEHVRLRRSGRSYVGLCPFHPDRNPSMNFNPEMGIFKCFSCGKAGDAIAFAREYHSLDFMDAIALLAKRTGMSMPESEETEAQQLIRSRSEMLRKCLTSAAEYYRKALLSPEGSAIQSYIKKRGFSEAISEEFGLGFSPDDWNRTAAALEKLGYTVDVIEGSGLQVVNEGGKRYDRFRGRLMFPLHDPSGRIVGFGARRMNEDKSQPKYINSPETDVYQKSRYVYGLFQAKKTIRDEGYAVLTEGYADVVSLHANGVKNAVASSGTALVREQLQLLLRYCRRLVMVYDGDPAGFNATLRGIEFALEEGFDVSVAEMPDGDDPDSFVQRRGAEAFRMLLNKASHFLDYLVAHKKSQENFDNPATQSRTIKELVELIVKVPDVLQHELLLQKLRGLFRMGEMQMQHVYDEYKRISKSSHSPRRQPSQQENPNAIKKTLPQQPVPKKEALLFPEEKMLLRLSLQNPKIITYLLNNNLLQEDYFCSPAAKEVFLLLKRSSERQDAEPLHVILSDESVGDETKGLMMDVVMKHDMPSGRWKKFEVDIPPENQRLLINDSLLQLRKRSIDALLQETQSLLSEANAETEFPLLKRIQELSKEKSAIEGKLKRIQ